MMAVHTCAPDLIPSIITSSHLYVRSQLFMATP
jgi:hypothetical protein